MLPPVTERVWIFLKEQPAQAGFVLVGGSALALRIRHRVSEDLDLACLDPHLPRTRLEALCRHRSPATAATVQRARLVHGINQISPEHARASLSEHRSSHS